MSDELDQILLVEGQEGFSYELGELRASITKAATFGPDDKEYETVKDIIGQVVTGGDEAVRQFTRKYDNEDIEPNEFQVKKEHLAKAHEEIDRKLLGSIREAIENVRRYQAEIFVGANKHPGIKYKPLKRVGVCVPGAAAPLPSTVIMTVVPAQVAGVKEIAIVSPPRYKGSVHPVILAICHELEISEVYRVGGVQAVAALALGTDTIAEVNKIVGPGNKWVQTAKQFVSGIGYVGIDSIAGPSEVLIIANDKANPSWVAADMLSQAEHAPGSAIVLTDSLGIGQKILEELKRQLGGLKRSEQTKECLTKYSKIAVFGRMTDVIECADQFASEHLEVQCGRKSREIAEKIENAGAIFIGDYTPVAVGDYWAGPSHTLPTGRTARFSSALTSNDFVKSISIIEYSAEQLAASAEDIIRLAEVEGLDAHARSVRIRQED